MDPERMARRAAYVVLTKTEARVLSSAGGHAWASVDELGVANLLLPNEIRPVVDALVSEGFMEFDSEKTLVGLTRSGGIALEQLKRRRETGLSGCIVVDDEMSNEQSGPAR